MKKLLRSKKVHMLFAAAALLVGSCYTIKNIEMPHEIGAGEEFTVRAQIISNEGEKSSSGDWGVLGVRVPVDFEVTIPENVLEHYNADGSFDKAWPGVPNDIVTAVLNYRYPQDGYKWLGFSTGLDGDEKQQFGFTGDDADFYMVNIKIKAGQAVGDYKLDFVFGDEEQSFAQYAENMDHNPNQDPRLFETGTFVPDPTKENGTKDDGTPAPSVRNSVTTLDTSLKVKDGASIEVVDANDEIAVEGAEGGIRVIAKSASAATAVVTVYDVQGRQLDCRSVVNGEATLHAAKGVNLVEVLKGNKKAVKKVFVK